MRRGQGERVRSVVVALRRVGTGVTDTELSARFARLAKQLHIRDCEHDVAKACWSLAYEELDTKWHERACNKGKIAECSSAAILYEEGEGMPANPKRAVRLYQRACEQGEATGCERAGRLRARVRR